MNEELKFIITAECGKLKSEVGKAKSAIGEFGEKVSSVGGKAKDAFKKIGEAAKDIAKVVGTAMVAAGGAIAKIGKDALASYADYEQLVGGVETLFKDSAGIIEEYANNAYKTAGLSANEYMETVTSFSASLLQSLDGDTAKAAKVADMAITDMADNANKMGTSMESIQNAYQGFAKQNYTMLDNLKLGYGGTKEEMQRLLADAEKLTGVKYDITNLNDVYSAIHAIQDNLGITGTTAKEASTTIQGSITSVKAAYQNLLTGLADPNQNLGVLIGNMVETVATAADNIIPKIVEMLPRISEAVSLLIEKVTELLPPLIEGVLPTLIQAAIELINGLVASFPQLVEIIVSTLPQFVGGLIEIVDGLIAVLPQTIQTIAEGLIACMPTLLNGSTELFASLINAFVLIIPMLIDQIPALIEAFVPALIDNLPVILGAAVKLFSAIVESIPKIIPALIKGLGTIIKTIKDELVEKAKSVMKFEWKFPKLKLPHFSLTGKFSLDPPSVPKLKIDWYAKGGVFENTTLFRYGKNAVGGLGENGAEAVVPLENNTKWMDILAKKLGEKMGAGSQIVLTVDGKTFAQTSIATINDLTRQTGSLGLLLA